MVFAIDVVDHLMRHIAGIFSHLTLSEALRGILVAVRVASGYGFFIGSLIAAVTGHHGLKIKSLFLNCAAFGCYVVGALDSMVGVPLIIWGALQAL